MATSFISKKQRIFAEARKKDAKPSLKKLAQAIKNIGQLSVDEKAKLKELVSAVYEGFVEKKAMPTKKNEPSKPTKKDEPAKPTKKPSRSIATILKEFKEKIGTARFREATKGTDIYRDMERPALKKGKRIVRKKGKTSNQYGTYKNKVGGTYYENRTNRSDINQPSDYHYPKLADGGMITRKKAKAIFDEYEENENNNLHSENVVLLAKNFGTKTDIALAQEILKKHESIGNIPKDLQKERYELHQKLYQKLVDAKNKMDDKGMMGKKKIMRKKVSRQNVNYDKKADSGLVGKPQGHRFTDKLAKRLGKTSYAKPTQEQIEKYRGKGVYSENRQDKSDVKPTRTYPSL